ncbi:MAG: lipid-A-disaccharide synthase [Pseudomonadota bacterium]|nr:lipid-A-disaccharide synthase [Pseudomonadota bacterium]
MLVAAEASGDVLGAGLARALRARLGDRLQLSGVGGARMAREGVQSPFDIAPLSILGLFEGLKAYPTVVRLADETAALADRERPHAAVLIDSWGFTLRVAQRIRRRSPETLLVKFVGPQVWATRPGRARVLAGAVDHLLSIHSFDAPHFEAAGLPTTFVGNPALARSFEDADPARFRAAIGVAPGELVMLAAPGSRPAEIARLLPPFTEAVRRVKAARPGLHLVVPVAETVAEQVKAALADWPAPTHLVEREPDKTDAMAAADVALACSGTVTTELALAGVPMVVGYRLGRLTYAVLNRILRTPYATLFNIAAGREVAPELIQSDCTGPKLAGALLPLLEDPERREAQRRDQFTALDRMGRGGPDPSEAAAEAVIGLLDPLVGAGRG